MNDLRLPMGHDLHMTSPKSVPMRGCQQRGSHKEYTKLANNEVDGYHRFKTSRASMKRKGFLHHVNYIGDA